MSAVGLSFADIVTAVGYTEGFLQHQHKYIIFASFIVTQCDLHFCFTNRLRNSVAMSLQMISHNSARHKKPADMSTHCDL